MDQKLDKNEKLEEYLVNFQDCRSLTAGCRTFCTSVANDLEKGLSHQLAKLADDKATFFYKILQN